MCIKTLEGICKSQSAKGGDLAARLKDLTLRGALDRRLADWALALDIAEGGERDVAKDHAGDLLDVAEAVAEYIFTFRARLEAFEQRRVKNRNSARRRVPVLTLISS